MESRRAEGLPAHRGLDQFHWRPGGSGLKVWRTSVPKHHDQQKDPLLRQPQEAPDRAPDEEYTRLKPFRVWKTVQNRRIDLSATDSDRRNRRRWHISGEVSPRQVLSLLQHTSLPPEGCGRGHCRVYGLLARRTPCLS